MNVNPIMAAIVEAADTLNTAPEDYINTDDGLKYCGKCHTPKEAYFPEQYRKNGLDKHPIDCKILRQVPHAQGSLFPRTVPQKWIGQAPDCLQMRR